MDSQPLFIFDDPYGKFKDNINAVSRYASSCDIRISTQPKPDGTPLALTIEIADCGTLDLDDQQIIDSHCTKYCVKVNYDGIKNNELPRVIDLLKGMFMVKKRLGKNISYSAIDQSLPFVISKDEYESLTFDFSDQAN